MVTLKTEIKTKNVYHPGDQVKKNEMGVARGKYGREERCILDPGFET